jgi:flagellar capping protein FliD
MGLSDTDMVRIRTVIAEETSKIVQPIANDITFLKTEVTSLKTEVTSLKTEVTSLKTDVTSLKTDVTSLKTEVKIESAKAANSRTDALGNLSKVPNKQGDMPPVWPDNIASLAVAGSELQPGSQKKVNWNKTKSLQLLMHYGDYYTDDEGDTDEKRAASSLRRRRAVAARIGVSARQLSDAAALSFAL